MPRNLSDKQSLREQILENAESLIMDAGFDIDDYEIGELDSREAERIANECYKQINAALRKVRL